MRNPSQVIWERIKRSAKEKDLQVSRDSLSKIGDLDRHNLDMNVWGLEETCSTTACLWGSMYIVTHGTTTNEPPCNEWGEQSDWHKSMNTLFYCDTMPADLALLLAESVGDDGVIDLSNKDLRPYGMKKKVIISYGDETYLQAWKDEIPVNIEGTIFA